MANQHTKVYWRGSDPVKCEADGTMLKERFYDAADRFGRWGMLCDACFLKVGVGLGVGKGQKFERQTDGRWLKTEG